MKRALVLSGGGTKGYYQIGALDYLINTHQKEYDILAGVSVGSLICSFLAQYKEGQQRKSYGELLELFYQIKNKHIYRNWLPFFRLASLWLPSLYNSRPCHRLIRKTMHPELIQKDLRVGAVDLLSGEFKMFDKSDPDIIQAILASSAIPGAFLPIKHGDSWYADGGIRTVTPLGAAIAAGADIIDVVICYPDRPTEDVAFKKRPTMLKVASRSLELMLAETISNDLKIAKLYNRLVAAGQCGDKREVQINVIRPTAQLDIDMLDFTDERRHDLHDQGYKDARSALMF